MHVILPKAYYICILTCYDITNPWNEFINNVYCMQTLPLRFLEIQHDKGHNILILADYTTTEEIFIRVIRLTECQIGKIK